MTETLPEGLRIFVYGTLKSGHGNHERLCKGALAVVPATVRGKLYAPSGSFPYANVPLSLRLARGTDDYAYDALLDAPWVHDHFTSAALKEYPWEIHGEVIVLDDCNRLAAFDRLEGYDAKKQHGWLYERVLVPVILEDGERITAWMYQTDHPDGELIQDGVWTEGIRLPKIEGSEIENLYMALDALNDAELYLDGQLRYHVYDIIYMVEERLNELEGYGPLNEWSE